MRFTEVRMTSDKHTLFVELVNHMLDAGWQITGLVRLDEVKPNERYYAVSMQLAPKAGESFGLFPLSAELAKTIKAKPAVEAELSAYGIQVKALLEEYERGGSDDADSVPSNNS